jgi:hypothetical protein
VGDRVFEVMKKHLGGNRGVERAWIVVVAFAVYLGFRWDSERLVEDTDTPAIFY